MKNSKQTITCAQAKEIDLLDYLKTVGHQPQKVRNNDFWYLSPLRDEKIASFKVNKKLNRWYDHGIGKGGNIIDFAILYHHCTIPEFLQSLEPNFSFHQPAHFEAKTENEISYPAFRFINSRTQHSLVLIRCLHGRNIPLALANKYCHERECELDGKMFYSIGFLNNAGGYELRNQFCKNCSSPKAITAIKNEGNKVAVFESFFDFLSFLALNPNEPDYKWDFCILNSLSFFEKSTVVLAQYESVHLFLDNDKAGQNCSRSALQLDKKYIDESRVYQNYKDLNEWIVTIGKRPNQVRMRFKL